MKSPCDSYVFTSDIQITDIDRAIILHHISIAYQFPIHRCMNILRWVVSAHYMHARYGQNVNVFLINIIPVFILNYFPASSALGYHWMLTLFVQTAPIILVLNICLTFWF